jgi:hypothetical protein
MPEERPQQRPQESRNSLRGLGSAIFNAALEQWPVLKPFWAWLKQEGSGLKQGWVLFSVLALVVSVLTGWGVHRWDTRGRATERRTTMTLPVTPSTNITETVSPVPDSGERIVVSDTVEQIVDELRDKTTHERDIILRDKYLGKWVKERFSFQDLNTEGGVVRVALYVEGKRGMEMSRYPPVTAIMDPSMLPKLTHLKLGESIQIQGQIRYIGQLEFDLVNAEVLTDLPRRSGAWPISMEQAQEMRQRLSHFKLSVVSLVSLAGDSEGLDFRNRLQDIFASENWIVSVRVETTSQPWKGVRVCVSDKDVTADLAKRMMQEGGAALVKPTELPLRPATVLTVFRDVLGVHCEFEISNGWLDSGAIEVKIGNSE